MDKKIEKDITFICTDDIEKQCCLPVAREAEKRGYNIHFTNNQFEKCNIGFYLSHVNFPKNSKFSIVCLHDLGQQHGEWPIMWKNEFWSQFDLGFLPSKEWADMWHNASCYDFVRPRYGCYLSGWIKADTAVNKNFSEINSCIIKEYGIDTSKKTILYAPAWEWDNRQLEIVNAVKDLDVNLIIKQYPVSETFLPEQLKIIEETHRKTRALEQENVYILDPKISIINVIKIADILVSEESSTLFEAMLMEKPVISVTDWLVPDVYPPRLPESPRDFAICTKKNDLHSTIVSVLSDKSYKCRISDYRKEKFPNIGNAAKTVMDVLDNVLYGAKNDVAPITELPLQRTPKEFKKTIVRRKRLMRHIFIKKKFVEKHKLLLSMWNMLRNVKNRLR